MDDLRGNGNVIEIIGGDVPMNNQSIGGDVPVNNQLINNGMQSLKSGNEPPIKESRNVPQGYLMEMNQSMENHHRSFKDRYCKMFYTGVGCLYGNQCAFLHDEQSIIRERNAIILSPGSNLGHGNGIASRNGIVTRNEIVNENGMLPAADATKKPASWRTKICKKWELTGYCSFGDKCSFAHGAAELQRYGGGFVNANKEDNNRNNQGFMFPNMVAQPSGSSGTRAGGSGQLPGTPERPWKGPNKISRIYGDWIDDI